MNGAEIGVLGAGGYLPAEVRDNEAVGAFAGVGADWILRRTGVRFRRRAAEHEAASDLAAHAVRAALHAAALDPAELDLLVLATSTPDDLGPSTACRVQALIGARRAVALDVGAACSGWLFGARIAVDWLRSGNAGHRSVTAAVVGVEAYSRFLDPADRGTAVLFGDGAGATVLGPVPAGRGFAPIALGSDGTKADYVSIPAGGSRRPATAATLAEGRHLIRMDGRAVREFALDVFPRTVQETLHRCGLEPADIDLVVSHQPNPVLLAEACAAAGLDRDRLVVTGDRTGNLGAGSIPYTLAAADAAGRLHPGDRVLIIAFGAGMTWGGTVLTWSRPSADGD